MAVRVFDELAGDRPHVRRRVDILPPHLQQFATALRSDETKPEPRADVWILRVARVPNAANFVAGEHAVATALFGGSLPPDDRIGRGRNEALLRRERENARHQRTNAV